MLNAFKTCDEVLLQGVQGITDLITTPGLINTDFADVRMIMSNAGSALMGIGYASGDGRAVNAARAAISSPMLEASIEGARGMLLNVSGPSDLGLFEVNEAAEIVAKAAHPDANIIFGAVIDDSLGDEVRITVIAAGFDRYEGERRPSRGSRRSGSTTTSSSATASTSRSAQRRRRRRRRRVRRPRVPALTESLEPSRDRARVGRARVVFTDRHGGVSAAPYDTAEPRRPRRRRPRRGRREPPPRLGGAPRRVGADPDRVGRGSARCTATRSCASRAAPDDGARRRRRRHHRRRPAARGAHRRLRAGGARQPTARSAVVHAAGRASSRA